MQIREVFLFTRGKQPFDQSKTGRSKEGQPGSSLIGCKIGFD
tara:strand:- start:475 stop:600 length:126 start_codon:yes stop_codon:yes gene_type:complete